MRSLTSRRRAQLSCRSLPHQCAISRDLTQPHPMSSAAACCPRLTRPYEHLVSCLQCGGAGGALGVGIIMILGFPIFLVCFVCGGWCCVCDSVQPPPSSLPQTPISVCGDRRPNRQPHGALMRSNGGSLGRC